MADAGIDVFLTMDRNLGYQQNLDDLKVAVLVLLDRSNKLEDLLPLMPAVREALTTIQAGEYREISGDDPS
jgi:hypothetical protein